MKKNSFWNSYASNRIKKLLLIMKISILISFTLILQISASVYSQSAKLDINASETKVKDILKIIESSSNFRFFFNDELVELDRRLSISASKKDIHEILGSIFKNSNISYKIFDNNVIVIAPTINFAQQTKVEGIITDVTNGEPVIGANVLIEGTTLGTITDVNGKFSMDVPNKDVVLVVSSLGFNTERVTLNGQVSLVIKLVPDIKKLEEVVVIGYGNRSKKDITTSISTISSKSISKSIALSPQMAMQGTMSGVQVSGNTGNPMDRPTVRIRGVNTWGVADPLYVIDGVPITELGGGIEGAEDARVSDVRGPVNIMTLIDPNDIESISVLKDASAAAIYGVRASNGVILITTKRGTNDTPQVEFSARYGVQNVVKKWNTLTTPEYVDFYKKAYAANPSQALDPEFNPSSPLYLGNIQETYDWQSPLINKNAPTQDYSLRISGRSTKTDYYASGSYTSNEGSLIGEGLDRYSLNLKLNTQASKMLKIGVNYRLGYLKGYDNNGSNLTDIAITPPWQPIYDPNGLEGYAQVVPGYNAAGVWKTDKLYGQGTRANHFGRMAINDTKYNTIRNFGDAYIEFNPFKGLSIKGSFSLDWYKNDRNQFLDYNDAYFNSGAAAPNSRGGGKSVGQYEERYTTNFNNTQEVVVNYQTKFGKHHFDVLLSGMDQQYNAKYLTAQTQYMSTRVDYLWTLGGENAYTMLESEKYRWALVGLLGRLSYNFDNKYYFDVTTRRDGSNRFAPANRWGIFPSASAAWRISAEPFMQDISWINDIKIRTGWGQLGNQEVRNLAYLSPIEKRPTYAFGSNPGSDGLGIYGVGAAMYSFPNPDLEWEKTTTINFGMDAVLFSNLSASIEYYDKQTDGILQTTNIPPSVGSKLNPVANIASVKNSGIEFSLQYNNSLGDFRYNAGANFTTVKNKVLSTYKGIPFGGNTSRIEDGYSMNYLWGYKVGGIFQSQEEIDEWLITYKDKNITQNYKPGDRWFVDVNGAPVQNNGNGFYSSQPDGTVDDYDRVYLGKTIPGYFYGFNLGMEYKNFDFSANFVGVGDVQKHNSALLTMEWTAARGQNASKNVLNAWTPENPSRTMARAVVGDPNRNLRFSNLYVENASYLRLNNVQLGYTIPKIGLNALGNQLSYIRIYTSISNAFVITKWRGLDPENDSSPMPRTFNFGINARF